MNVHSPCKSYLLQDIEVGPTVDYLKHWNMDYNFKLESNNSVFYLLRNYYKDLDLTHYRINRSIIYLTSHTGISFIDRYIEKFYYSCKDQTLVPENKIEYGSSFSGEVNFDNNLDFKSFKLGYSRYFIYSDSYVYYLYGITKENMKTLIDFYGRELLQSLFKVYEKPYIKYLNERKLFNDQY